MNLRSSSSFVVIAIIGSLVVGCKASDSAGGTSATPAQDAQTPEASSAKPSEASTLSHAITTSGSSFGGSTSGCFDYLLNDSVFENYRVIGVRIEIDCAAMAESNYFHHHRLSKIADTLKVLERSIDLFKDWPHRPTKIVIGERAYHSSRKNVIQVPFVTADPKNLENYLRDTRLLMDLEITHFNRSVRFSYVDYDLAHLADGEIANTESGGLTGYGAAREQIVKDDIARVLRLKKSIKQMPFTNIILTHPNPVGSFRVSQWSSSYTLPLEYTDEQLAPYFEYLTKLSEVQRDFGTIAVSVAIPVYPHLDIQQALKAVDILGAIKNTVDDLAVKSVHVSQDDPSQTTQRFRVSKRDGELTIHSLHNPASEFQTSGDLKKCLEEADLETTTFYFCDGRGPLRY